MKLVFFSDQKDIETKIISERLFELIGKPEPCIGYISSCPDVTKYFYLERKNYYSMFGANIGSYFDLEDGFDKSIVEQIFESDPFFKFYDWATD